MTKDGRPFLGDECPSLTSIPVSAQHDGRFGQSAVAAPVASNTVNTMTDEERESKSEKTEDNQR